jgi:hypothetical protein
VAPNGQPESDADDETGESHAHREGAQLERRAVVRADHARDSLGGGAAGAEGESGQDGEHRQPDSAPSIDHDVLLR